MIAKFGRRGSSKISHWLVRAVLGLVAGLFLAQPGLAQAPDSGLADREPTLLSSVDLESLFGPIALYPDDLLAIVLPATTYPLQIVEAARFLDAHEDNPDLQPDDDWDDAIVALLNYPDVLRMLNEDLDWTWSLGEAVLNQEADVIDAIQSFRNRAYLAGNLKTDDHLTVSQHDGIIEITLTDPQVVYVPYYEPTRVVVVQSAPEVHYYSSAYPVYYYPYPPGYAFPCDYFWGVTSAFSIGWSTHLVSIFPHFQFQHPYYSYYYYAPYFVRFGYSGDVNSNYVSHVWRPGRRPGSRPNEGRPARQVTRTREDYTRNLRGRPGADRRIGTDASSEPVLNGTLRTPAPTSRIDTVRSRVDPQPATETTTTTRTRMVRRPVGSVAGTTSSTASGSGARITTGSRPSASTSTITRGRPGVARTTNPVASPRPSSGTVVTSTPATRARNPAPQTRAPVTSATPTARPTVRSPSARQQTSPRQQTAPVQQTTPTVTAPPARQSEPVGQTRMIRR